MENKSLSLTIGAVAAAAGVGIETIRFYQRKGLLDEPERTSGAIRCYGQREVARIRFIKSAQRLGFSLDEVSGLLVLEDGTHCDEARTLAEAKLVTIKAKLAGLNHIKRALLEMISQCHHSGGSVCCPMIVALQTSEVH